MNLSEIRPLPNAADKATLKTIAATVVPACPSLQDAAHEIASNLLKQHGLSTLDPDQVYFHRFKAAQSSTRTFTGWEHILEKPYETLTLTQLVIHRFRATDKDNADLLDLYAGFYASGPDVENFNETNEVRLHGDDVLKAFWDIDFSTLYLDRISGFWSQSSDDFRTLAKCNFLSCAIRALEMKQLSGDDFQRFVDAVIGPVTWPVSLKTLQSTRPVGNDVRALDVVGHVATNMLRMVEANGRQIVYVPGEAPAFHVMETEADMHWWVLERMNKDTSRKAFMAHFSLADRQDIERNITDVMNRLVGTWGKSDHHLINQLNQAVKGDAFSWLRESSRRAMYAEASLSLTSNSDLRKKLWIGYLSAGLKVFGPMAAVGWPVALPVIGASIANMGLNIDQAVNGKTSTERKAGVLGAVMSGIDALFNVPFLKSAGSTLEVGAQVEAAEAAEWSEFTQQPETPVTTHEEPGVPGSDDVFLPADPEPFTVIAPETASPPVIPDKYLTNELLDGMEAIKEPGKFQGIYRLDSEPSHAVMMDDNAYYVRYFPDSRGGGYWAIVDPERPSQFAHSLPIQLNAEGQWERMRSLRLNGGGQCLGKGCSVELELDVRNPAPVSLAVPPHPATWRLIKLVRTVFDTPPSRVSSLRSWALDLPEGADTGAAAGANPSSSNTYLRNYDLRHGDLLRTAQRYFAYLPWSNLPPRPPMPSVTLDMPMEMLFERIFQSAPGLVIGESLDRIASMRLIIEKMPALARHVDTIYVRRLLCDFAQTDLNDFFRTGDMSEDLQHYLTSVGSDPAGVFNELELVRTARQNGVRIQALDNAVNYKSDTLFERPRQQAIANYVSNDIITSDKALNNPGKWIVLTGRENTNTFRGISGISELQGGIGLRIEEVNPGEVTGVDVDPGIEVSTHVHPNATVMRGISDPLFADLRLRIAAPPVTWTESALERLLCRQGMFVFEKSTGSYTLIHRSTQEMLVRTPVQVLADGQFAIHRPSWPRVINAPFHSLEALADKLNHIGLTLQSRIPE